MIAGGGREARKEGNEWHTNLPQTDLILESGLHLRCLPVSCEPAVLLSLCTEIKNDQVSGLPGDNTQHSQKENSKPVKINNRSLEK